MALEVHLLSKELIKPSSPTPHHLQKYQLSFLDQTAPEVFVPLILYYSPDDVGRLENTTTASNNLKNSLSKTLTLFYPLAGRRTNNNNNNNQVDCNDEGALFVEAYINHQLSDIISNPIPNELNKLLPLELDDVSDLNLAIQLNSFKDGGIAVAVTISHKLADALTLFNFINTWAAISRGDHDNVQTPVFGSATLFPPLDVTGFHSRIGVVKENIVCKRFVFCADKIAALRDKYTADHGTNHNDEYSYRPTRVEALSTFIWIRYKEAVTPKTKGDDKKMYAILHPVNLRKKFDPPLPDNSFGNLYQVAMTIITSTTENEDTKSFELVHQMRGAIKSIDAGFVEKLRKGESDYLMFVMEMSKKFEMGEGVPFSFTSLCRFGLYEADFGWGKPVWIGSTLLTFRYVVSFFETKVGEGIEAWINLEMEEMAKFEVDKELLEFVENPCPKLPGAS